MVSSVSAPPISHIIGSARKGAAAKPAAKARASGSSGASASTLGLGHADQRADRRQLLRAQAEHASKRLRRLEPSSTIALLDDPPGERGPDAGKARDLLQGRRVEIEWPGV